MAAGLSFAFTKKKNLQLMRFEIKNNQYNFCLILTYPIRFA